MGFVEAHELYKLALTVYSRGGSATYGELLDVFGDHAYDMVELGIEKRVLVWYRDRKGSVRLVLGPTAFDMLRLAGMPLTGSRGRSGNTY